MCCRAMSEGFLTCQTTRDSGMLQVGLDFGTQFLLLTSGHDLIPSVTLQWCPRPNQWKTKFQGLPTDEIWYQDTKSQNNILKSPKATTHFDFCTVLYGQSKLASEIKTTFDELSVNSNFPSPASSCLWPKLLPAVRSKHRYT